MEEATDRRSAAPDRRVGGPDRRVGGDRRQMPRDPAPATDRPVEPEALPVAANAPKLEAQDQTLRTLGGVRILPTEMTVLRELAKIQFHAILNEKINLAALFSSRVAVAQVSPNEKTVVLFLDRFKVTGDDLAAIVDVLRKQGYSLPASGPQGYYASSSLVLSLAKGNITPSTLAVEREISRDPTKNALLSSFTDVIAWSYGNGADDIDFVVDLTQPNSQIAFKIGGRYVRPPMFMMPTDTVMQMLGIAWQRSGGGSSAQFQTNIEQQAKVELHLPRSEHAPDGANVRLRWSGMANDRGTVVTLRLQRLGASAKIRSLTEAGYPRSQLDTLMRVIHSEGGIITFSGVVGSGKSTSLAQLLAQLPKDIKMISIEDPVELEIPGMYQKTVARDLTATGEDPAFVSATRAIYRSALDVLLLGEIRDSTTGLLARQVAESGHSVYTTTHARSALGVIDRFASPAIGIPRDVLATPDIIKLLVYQALVPVTCKHCGKAPDDYARALLKTNEELTAHGHYFDRIERLYGLDRAKFRMRDHNGCPHCRKANLPELNGFSGRTVVSEMIEPDDMMLRHILSGNNIELNNYWRSKATPAFDDENLVGKTTMECAVLKASWGLVDPREIEPRFKSFETVEMHRKLHGGKA